METIPRHERAVFPSKEGRIPFVSTSVAGFNYSHRQLFANAAIAASRVGS